MVLLLFGIIYVAFFLVPFPCNWTSLNARYTILGLVIPLIISAVLLWNAQLPSDYRTTQNVMKFVLFMGVLYAFVIQQQI